MNTEKKWYQNPKPAALSLVVVLSILASIIKPTIPQSFLNGIFYSGKDLNITSGRDLNITGAPGHDLTFKGGDAK